MSRLPESLGVAPVRRLSLKYYLAGFRKLC